MPPPRSRAPTLSIAFASSLSWLATEESLYFGGDAIKVSRLWVDHPTPFLGLRPPSSRLHLCELIMQAVYESCLGGVAAPLGRMRPRRRVAVAGLGTSARPSRPAAAGLTPTASSPPHQPRRLGAAARLRSSCVPVAAAAASGDARPQPCRLVTFRDSKFGIIIQWIIIAALLAVCAFIAIKVWQIVSTRADGAPSRKGI